ncbi:MAG: hypothetical protein LBQ93_10290 [Treponema sp.]|jgi:uncharacterized protein (TIGR03545 family)|nr:hypothetical protein [Treponema sp.]
MEKEETEKKEQKPVKAPGKFKKPVKIKTFEKKYVKYIEHPQDKDFFISCFEKQDNAYRIRDTLNKDDVKKLKTILKVIKANHKGAVNFIPLAFAAAVVAAIVVFFTIFANPLLERALEDVLESVFEAKSDVTGLRLSLLRFRISIGSITVANRDSPMINLFQMGRTEIRLKPQAVLRGKIYIEEIRADTIRFGTERTVSGALPGKPPKEKQERPKSDAPPLIDLRNFDAMALLNQEYDKLKTPKLYDEAINAYNETAAKWKNQIESTKGKVEELRTASAPLLSLNASSIRDVETVRGTIQDINTMLAAVQTTADEAGNIVSGIEADINNARQLEQNARNALTDDINRLKSLVDLGSGSAFEALEPFLMDMLSDTAQEYLDYGLRALEVLEKLKAMADAQPKNEKPVKEPKVVFKGRDVNFPVVNYPKFFLGILASDFTLNTWNWAFDMRDISSNPDLTDKPVTLSLGLTEDGGALERQIGFKGSADFRTNPSERFTASVNGKGFPLSLGNRMNNIGISGFSGETSFSVSLAGQTSGAFSSGSDVNVYRPMLIDPRGTLAEAADTAIREAGNVNLGIQYNYYVDRKDEFKITSNIAELFAQAVRRIAETYAQRAMDEIERALRQRIEQYIDGRFVSKDEVDLLFRTARGNKESADVLKNALTNKKNEFEQRLRAAADETVQQVRDDTSRQAEQAVQDLLQGNQPSFQTPTLPGLPGR